MRQKSAVHSCRNLEQSFNGRLRDELLNGEIFYTLAAAKVVIEGWRQHDNKQRQHSSLGYRSPLHRKPGSYRSDAPEI